jgi:hypothetical protein
LRIGPMITPKIGYLGQPLNLFMKNIYVVSFK